MKKMKERLERSEERSEEERSGERPVVCPLHLHLPSHHTSTPCHGHVNLWEDVLSVSCAAYHRDRCWCEVAWMHHSHSQSDPSSTFRPQHRARQTKTKETRHRERVQGVSDDLTQAKVTALTL